MVGIGEGYHQEERSVLILAARQPRAGLIGDVGCGIILLRHLGPDRLRHGIIMGELVIPAAQLEHVRRDPPQPLFVVSAGVGEVLAVHIPFYTRSDEDEAAYSRRINANFSGRARLAEDLAAY